MGKIPAYLLEPPPPGESSKDRGPAWPGTNEQPKIGEKTAATLEGLLGNFPILAPLVTGQQAVQSAITASPENAWLRVPNATPAPPMIALKLGQNPITDLLNKGQKLTRKRITARPTKDLKPTERLTTARRTKEPK